MLSIINNMDQDVLFYIQSALQSQIMDRLMVFMTSLGDRGFLWIVISLALMANRKTRIVGVMTLSALALSAIMGEGILKHLIKRPRPYVDLPSIKMLIRESTAYSFPSGHTMSSFAAAYVLSKGFKRCSVLFFGVASLIAFSRMYLFMHYPTDVLAGIALGLACGKVVVDMFKKAKIDR